MKSFSLFAILMTALWLLMFFVAGIMGSVVWECLGIAQMWTAFYMFASHSGDK